MEQKGVRLKITEKMVENQILEYLINVIKIQCWKNNNIGVFDSTKGNYRTKTKYEKIYGTGQSDIIGLMPDGRFLAIEVKAPTNKLRPDHQQDFIDRINSNGGVAFFADSISVVKEHLSRHCYPLS